MTTGSEMQGTTAQRRRRDALAHPLSTRSASRQAASDRVRVAIVTESFLPALNGVTTSVCKVLESLSAAGHEALVIAPGTSPWSTAATPERFAGFPIHPVTSLPVRQFRVGLPSYELETVLHRFGPDVVHVSSPFILGMRGLTAARALGLASVAIYQTDMPSYIRQHSGPAGNLTARATWRWIRRIHAQADITLAPSTSALRDLQEHGIERTALWGRGVDADLFHPDRASDEQTRQLRARLAPNDEILLGYVGRLAPEKELHRLAELAAMPGVRLVLVGEGPSEEMLAEALPTAHFLGRREGIDLARCYAACDAFVHTGTRETFGQTLQEAAASCLPVIAPARGGPLDLVEQGRTGILFDPEAPGALVAAVSKLIGSDPIAGAALRAQMGKAGRERVMARSWPELTRQLVEHYRAAISARSLSR